MLYNPLRWERDRHQPFEVYKLAGGEYQQQIGEPFWLPEVGLGIGRVRQPVGGIDLEVLLWHDEQGQPYPVPEAEMKQLRLQLQAERQRAERMAEYLRSLGLDPDNLPDQG